MKQDIEEQTPVSKEAEADYSKAKREYYEYLQRDDCNDVSKATLQKGIGLRKKEFDEEKEKLDKLTEEYAQVEAISNRIRPEELKEIAWKSKCYLDVMRKYLPNIGAKQSLEKKRNTDTTEASRANMDIDEKYLPIRITSVIHNLCDGRQFESVSAIDFHRAVNLEPETDGLKIKGNEKARVCYLINEVTQFVETSLQNEWKEGICEMLGIDRRYLDQNIGSRSAICHLKPVRIFPRFLRKCLIKSDDFFPLCPCRAIYDYFSL